MSATGKSDRRSRRWHEWTNNALLCALISGAISTGFAIWTIHHTDVQNADAFNRNERRGEARALAAVEAAENKMSLEVGRLTSDLNYGSPDPSGFVPASTSPVGNREVLKALKEHAQGLDRAYGQLETVCTQLPATAYRKAHNLCTAQTIFYRTYNKVLADEELVELRRKGAQECEKTAGCIPVGGPPLTYHSYDLPGNLDGGLPARVLYQAYLVVVDAESGTHSSFGG